MSAKSDTATAVKRSGDIALDPRNPPARLADSGPAHGPCLWCGKPSMFRALDGDFCTDEHAGLHRLSEPTYWRRAVAQ